MQNSQHDSTIPSANREPTQHPGIVLRDELSKKHIPPTVFAQQCGLSPVYVDQVIAGNQRITADAAVAFGVYTDTSARGWLDLQSTHDLAQVHSSLGHESLDHSEEETQTLFKSIIDMRPAEAREFLLNPKSYCSIHLPNYFQFGPLLSDVSEVLDPDKFSTRGVTHSKRVNHRMMTNKDGRYAWRPLELIHPALYVFFVREITRPDNWETIIDRFRSFGSINSVQCPSLPVKSLDSDDDNAAQIQQWRTEIEQKSIELSLDYECMFQTDIVDCYASIYSHAIAWALDGKDSARQRQDASGPLGNVIDRKIRQMHMGQSIGIPQGSKLMDLVAEIVLGYADEELARRCAEHKIRGYHILRYRDDYRIFVNSQFDGEAVLKQLTEILAELGLKINPAKTNISNAVVRSSMSENKLEWMFRRQRSNRLQHTLLMIHDHGWKYPNSGQLDAALMAFHERLRKLERHPSPVPLIAIAVDIAVRNPRTYPHVAAILAELVTFIPNDWAKLDVIARVRRRFATIPNGGHMEVWLQRISFQYDHAVEFTEPLCGLVSGQGSGLWNNEWIDDEALRAAIGSCDLINREILRTMGPTIDPSELRIFASAY